MAREVEYTDTTLRQLRKLDQQGAQRIVDYLDDVVLLEDPRSRRQELVGDRASIWRFRVGDDRVLRALRDAEMVILTLCVDQRGSIDDT